MKLCGADKMSANVFVSEPVSHVLELYDGLLGERAWDRPVVEQLELLAGELLVVLQSATS